MATVSEHYSKLLSRHYSWMSVLPFEAKVAEQKALIDDILRRSHGARPHNGFAIDLGAGPGFQTVALAELGFSPVLAVDSSAELLSELEQHKGQYEIETKIADITELAADTDRRKAAVIVCMGTPSRISILRMR